MPIIQSTMWSTGQPMQSGWLQEYAWQCEEHGWNTCPLTPSALRFSAAPCCGRATILVTRQRALPLPAAHLAVAG